MLNLFFDRTDDMNWLWVDVEIGVAWYPLRGNLGDRGAHHAGRICVERKLPGALMNFKVVMEAYL